MVLYLAFIVNGEFEERSNTVENQRERVRRILELQFQQAVERRSRASEAFSAVNADVPSGLPHPDGVLRITKASREYSDAIAALSRALKRKTDFAVKGIIPEDLAEPGA